MRTRQIVGRWRPGKDVNAQEGPFEAILCPVTADAKTLLVAKGCCYKACGLSVATEHLVKGARGPLGNDPTALAFFFALDVESGGGGKTTPGT